MIGLIRSGDLSLQMRADIPIADPNHDGNAFEDAIEPGRLGSGLDLSSIGSAQKVRAAVARLRLPLAFRGAEPSHR